ncbi:MAG TPA: hypothetical protein VF371_06640 [Candidatus Limnocylindrales bacterium]
MNQKSEDYLREWFRAGPLPDEPDSLHDFLAAVPLEHPRTTRGRWAVLSIWPQRALAGLAAALVVAIIGGTILFGLMNRSNSPIPGGTPSPTATASGSNPGPTASASPTATASGSNPVPTETASSTPDTSWMANLPTLAIPAAAIKTASGVSLPASDSVSSQVWGSRYYVADWTAVDAGLQPTGSATSILRYGDVSTGKTGSVPLPLTQAEMVGLRTKFVGGGFSVATDGSNLAVVVGYRLGAPGDQGIPCGSNSGAPIAWRILVAPIDQSTGAPGTFSAIAGGQSKVAFRPMGGEGCDTVSAPLVSLSGGRIAYNIENPTTGHPLASKILVWSLAGGAPDRQIQTVAMPIGLELSGTNVAWLESDGNAAVPLRISTAAHPEPADVDTDETPGGTGAWTIPKFSLDGDQIAWDRYGTGQVFLETIGGSADRISPSGVDCLLGGSSASQVLLMCYPGDPFFGNGNLVIWSSSTGLQLVQGYPAAENGFSWLSNGWVATVSSDGAIVSFFRLSDLAK